MAALIDLLLQQHVSTDDLLLWLDGAHMPGKLEEMASLRVEFVPVFLNYLRDQSSGVLQVGVSGWMSPVKAPCSVRVTKYVSPGKDRGRRGRFRRHQPSAKAKTLQFPDTTPIKDTSSFHSGEAHVPDVEKVLREESTKSPSHATSTWASLPSTGATSTPRHLPPKAGTRSDSFHVSPGRRFGGEGSEHGGGKRNHSFDQRHSEQRLSLGDFMTTDMRVSSKKKSPHPRESRSDANAKSREVWSLRQKEVPEVLDISDQDAFPVIGTTPIADKQQKRRINPTRIATSSSHQSSKNSLFGQDTKVVFGVPNTQVSASPFSSAEGGGSKTMEEERELLRQEKLKRQNILNTAVGGSTESSQTNLSPPNQAQQKVQEKAFIPIVEPSPDMVTNQSCLDILAKVYAEMMLYNFVPNIMVELYYIMQLLTLRIILNSEAEQRSQCSTVNGHYLNTVHNCVYFATNVLLLIIDLEKLLDKGTIKILLDNPRILLFSEELHKQLLSHLEQPTPTPQLDQTAKSPICSVSFQSDTDNRNNFPNDQSFHIFRKQRDIFYEILRIWDENHLTPGWSFEQVLSCRILQLLNLCPNSSNFVHFARLFQSQLLTMCHGEDQSPLNQDPEDLSFLATLKKQHPEKYKRLYERLVTPSKLGGPCPAPSFPGSQEFFRDFISTASCPTLNQHLKDVLIHKVLTLNQQEFGITDQEEEDPVDTMARGQARAVILDLRLLAKFLGFLEFFPYQTKEHLPENVMASHIALRSKVCPGLNLCAVLRECAVAGQLVIGVTWMVEFLSMVDPVALHTCPYLTIIMALVAVHKLLYIIRPEGSSRCPKCPVGQATHSFAPSNSLFLRLFLGWLFDLPNFPDGLFFTEVSEAEIDHQEYRHTVEVLTTQYTRMCVDCLRRLTRQKGQLTGGQDISQEDGTASPTKQNSLMKDIEKTQSVTPSKQLPQGASVSPLKTPSKFLAVSMLETPQVTPLKATDSQAVAETTLCLDASDFIDHQMITICCPFINELKNLLSDFELGMGSCKSTNSFRKITPMSASDKTFPTQTQTQLQLQLEENFFHNQPSSVRKTVDFVIERLSSNVIKKIRTKTIPELKEQAVKQLKELIEELVSCSAKTRDQQRDQVNKKVVELSHNLVVEARARGSQLAQDQCSVDILPAITLLLPPDITTSGVEVCSKLVSRCTQEKVAAWTHTHLTTTLFSKDLTADGDRLLRQAHKLLDFQHSSVSSPGCGTVLSPLDSSETASPVKDNSSTSIIFPLSPIRSPAHQPYQMFQLPRKAAEAVESFAAPAKTHNLEALSPSQVLMSVKELLHQLVKYPIREEEDMISEPCVMSVLEDVRKCVQERQDLTLAVHRALQSLTVDLTVSLSAITPSLMTADIQEKCVQLWRPRANKGVLPAPPSLCSVLCPRTVMLVAQNPDTIHHKNAWKKLEELVVLLLAADLLTPATLLEHCVALLRHTWPQEVLSGISTCIEGVTRTALKEKRYQDDENLLQMLDWIGWVCEQMDDFGEEI